MNIDHHLTSANSERAQGIFSKITFLKSVHSKEKDEACLGFLVKDFTKSFHRGGVNDIDSKLSLVYHKILLLFREAIQLKLDMY